MSFGLGIGTLGCDQLGGLIGGQPIPTTGIHVIVNGTIRSGAVDQETISIKEELGGRSELSVAFKDFVGEFHPHFGEEIYVYADGLLKFAGIILEVDEQIELGTSMNLITIEASDFSILASWHLVTFSYTQMSFYDIVTLILTRDSGEIGERLVNDGVTVDSGAIERPGPTFSEANFDKETCEECFNQIAKATGYWWDIDYRKVLIFLDRAARACPFALDDATFQEYRDVRVKRGNDAYRNIQTVIGGVDKIGQLRLDRFDGDDSKKTFTLTLPVAKSPLPVVLKYPGAIAQTIGIKEVDTDKDWYYQVGEDTLTQDSGDGNPDALAVGEYITVEYFGEFPIVQVSRNESEIARLKSISSTSGVIEHVETEEKINSAAMAEELAAALIRQNAKEFTEITFSTSRDGARPGQLIRVNLPGHAANGDYLITNVRFGYVGVLNGVSFYRWQITCTDGEYVGGWADFWRRLSIQGRPFSINPNEKYLTAREISDVVGVSDSVVTDQPLSPWLDDPLSVFMVGSPIGFTTESVTGDYGLDGVCRGPSIDEALHKDIA